jgi:hypothetical protein
VLPPARRVLPASSVPPMSSALVTSVASSSASTSLDFLKQQEDVALKAHATSVYFKYFRCFISMLQVFHVVVAYLAMGIHVCWKCIVPNVSSISDACCKCFIRMLHIFHTYVASVSSLDVAYVSHICCKCFISMLHMFCNGYTRVFLVLQVFQLFWTHVASVLSRYCKSRSSVAHVIVGPICRSLLLDPHAYAWVWRGASARHGKQCRA